NSERPGLVFNDQRMPARIKQLEAAAGVADAEAARRVIGNHRYFFVSDAQLEAMVPDVDADADGGRRFGVDAIFKGVLDKGDQQEGAYLPAVRPALDLEDDLERAFEAGLLQLDIVCEIGELALQRYFFFACFDQHIAHHRGKLDDGSGRLFRSPQRHGVDAVERVEQKMRIDLCFEIGEFRVQLFLFGPDPAIADL